MTPLKLLILSLGVVTCVRGADPVATQPAIVPTADYGKIDMSTMNRQLAILTEGDTPAAKVLMENIQKVPGDYAPPVIILMAKKLFDAKDAQGAYFWFCFGRLRFLYDAERCADLSARSSFGEMIASVKPELRQYPTTLKPEEIVPLARSVVHLDSVSPYNYDLHWINLLGAAAFDNSGKPLSVPEGDWPQIHTKVCADYLQSALEMTEEVKNLSDSK